MSNLTLREATTPDLPTLAAILRAAFEEYRAYGERFQEGFAEPIDLLLENDIL